MVVQKISFKADVLKMRQSLEEDIFKLGPPVIQSYEHGFDGFGGWSVTSRTGDWRDGYQQGHDWVFRKDIGYRQYSLAKYLGLGHPMEYDKFTEAATYPFKELIDRLERSGFYPRRARINILKAGHKSALHRDGPDNSYMLRLHVPIITNSKCKHLVLENNRMVEYNMPADGSVYAVRVNNLHQVINESEEDRYHLIMDAYDTRKYTIGSHYNKDDVFKNIEAASKFREEVDKIKLNWVQRFDFYTEKKLIGFVHYLIQNYYVNYFMKKHEREVR